MLWLVVCKIPNAHDDRVSYVHTQELNAWFMVQNLNSEARVRPFFFQPSSIFCARS